MEKFFDLDLLSLSVQLQKCYWGTYNIEGASSINRISTFLLVRISWTERLGETMLSLSGKC